MYVIVQQGAAFKGAFGAPILIELMKQRKPDLILGVSSGAWNGVACAAGKEDLLKTLWMSVDDSNVLDGVTGFLKTAIFSRMGLLDLQPLRKMLELNIKLSDIKIPFGAGVTIRETKQYKTLMTENMKTDKELYDAIQGSASIAFLIKPVTTSIEDKIVSLSDGGHKHTIPILPSHLENSITDADIILCNPIDAIHQATSDVNGLAASLQWLLDTQSVLSQAADLFHYKVLAFKGIRIRVFAPQVDLGGMFQTDRKTMQWRWKLGEEAVKNPQFITM